MFAFRDSKAIQIHALKQLATMIVLPSLLQEEAVINHGEVVTTVLNGGAGSSSYCLSLRFQNSLSCIAIEIPLLDRPGCLRAGGRLGKGGR